MLLTEGSDIRINDTDVSGSTVLHHAAHFGIPEVINVLLEHGADVWIKDCDGMNAYDLVCEGTSPGHVSVASLLYHKFSTRCPPPTSDAMVAQSSAANLSPGKFKRVDSYLAVETALSKHASPLRPHPLFRIIDSRESSSRPATASSIPNFSPIPEISSPTLCKSASTPNNPLFRSATKSKKPTSAFGMSIDKNFNSNSPMKSALKFDKMTVTLSPPDAHVPFVPTNARINQSVFNMTGGASGDADIKLTNNLSLTILFGVEQCHNCENHAWCVWHDEEKYKSNADEALLMCICTFLNRPKLPLTVFGYHSRASKTRLGALELYCSIFVPNGMNMGRFDPENETDPNMYGSTPDKLNGGTWLHHVLHSKLKTKTWPNIASIQENLLAIVEYLFSINNKRSLLSASASESTFTFNLSPVKQNSKRCIVLSPSNSAVDVTMDSRLDYKHMHMGMWMSVIVLCA